ncbi:MAG: ATP-binding protein [Pseudomonadota bacterium]|nr:ATP-binding protein [Pseudomonadota bacterium]
MRGVFFKIYLAFMVTAIITTSSTLILAAYYRQWSNDSINLIAPTGGYISAAELILQQGGEPLLLEWLLRFERHPSVNAYVFDDQGLSLLPNPPQAVMDYAFSPESYEALINPLGRSEILVKAPLQSVDGRVYLLVVEFLHPLVVFNLPAYLGWGLLASVLLFAVWSLLLSGYLTRPVRFMQRTVKAFANGDWQARMDKRSLRRRDELGDLSREFNHMASYIERLIQDQKQLVSDVSHELRSPLARSTVALELARLDAVPDQEEHLDRIELETQRLNDMIEDLLNMAKLETQQDHSHWRTLDMGDLLTSVVEDARFEHPDSLINLTIADGLKPLVGDANLLKSALENITRNALLHTDAGTSVDVSVRLRAEQLRVVIRDHGPGVPEDKLQDLLRPFVRAESARQRLGGNHRGFGLGLAIAHRVISHHRGQITLRNHRDGGLIVSIELPTSV